MPSVPRARNRDLHVLRPAGPARLIRDPVEQLLHLVLADAHLASSVCVRDFDHLRSVRRAVPFACNRECCTCLAGKVRSGCRGLLGERDVVSEAFELFDEPFGLAFGVAVGEVVGAEVAVGLAGAEHLPDRAGGQRA
jgi:hypothetical protein